MAKELDLKKLLEYLIQHRSNGKIMAVVVANVCKAIENQGFMINNGGEIVPIEPEHKFNVGDTIRNKKYGDKYTYTIKEVLSDSYVTTDEKVLSFEFEDKWELVESEELHSHSESNKSLQNVGLTEFEQFLKSGTNIYVEQGRHMEDWDAKTDAKELLDIARKQFASVPITSADFEKELEACSLRYPEVSFAKMSRIAKRFYELGRNSVLDEEKELAYKTRDAIQYHDGYCNAIASARAIVEKHFSSLNVYSSCIDTLRDDILRELSDCIGLDKGE